VLDVELELEARMNDPLALTLDRARRRVLARLHELEAGLDAGEVSAWPAYLATLEALMVLAHDRQQPGRLLTTRELADRLGVSSKTIQRHRKTGTLTPALARGRVIRWAADSVSRGTAPGTAPTVGANDARGTSLSRAVRGEQRR